MLSLSLKDANEMLVKDKAKEVIDAIWGASTYTPEGIVAGKDTWELVAALGGRSLHPPATLPGCEDLTPPPIPRPPPYDDLAL